MSSNVVGIYFAVPLCFMRLKPVGIKTQCLKRMGSI